MNGQNSSRRPGSTRDCRANDDDDIKPLVHIYNVSYQSGIFPYTMKKAKIRPLFKKGDRQEMQNYRPISILSMLSRILEKLMYNISKKA